MWRGHLGLAATDHAGLEIAGFVVSKNNINMEGFLKSVIAKMIIKILEKNLLINNLDDFLTWIKFWKHIHVKL